MYPIIDCSQNELLTSKGYVRSVMDILHKAKAVQRDSSANPQIVQKQEDRAVNAPKSDDQERLELPDLDEKKESTISKEKCLQDYKDLLEKYERLGRQHAEAILELSQCKNNFRHRLGTKNDASPGNELLDSVDD